MHSHFDVEKLLMDESFLDYCQNKESSHKQKWEALISNDPDFKKKVEEVKDWLLILSPELSKTEIAIEVEKMRKLISSRNKAVVDELIDSQNGFRPDDESFRRKRKPLRILVLSSALIITAAGIYFGFNTNKKVAGVFEGGASFHTGLGERKEFQLPDGSIAILNSNATITLEKYYNNEERRVSLKGGAFFKVKANAGKPFTVIGPHFSSTALGTSFYVDGSTANDAYSIELLEGKLRLTANDHSSEPAILNAGEIGLWDKDKSHFEKKKFDTNELKLWLTGSLSFKKMPAEKVIPQLEKWYAVEIEVRRANWEKVLISGDYQNAALDDILKVICFSLSWNYRYEENKIIIQ